MSSSSCTFAVEIGLVHLFENIQKKFKLTKLSDESWYILTIACLVASPDPDLAAQLYVYLREKGEYPTPETRQGLMRRLREALVKSISLIGVCKPIEAVIAISEVENEEDKDYSTTRKEWQANDENHSKGTDYFEKMYNDSSKDRERSFDAHLDFAWISTEITLGLYLSDRQVLDDIDTEMVVLPAIMMQNLKNETHWNILGARRMGLSKEDVHVVWECVHMVAEHCGVKLNKVPCIDQVEAEA